MFDNMQVMFCIYSRTRMSTLSVYISMLSVLLACVPTCKTEDCKPGWFGAQCQFQCHCADDSACNKTRGCPEGLCQRGWFGPVCQYVDLVSQLFTPDWLNDNNETTCNSNHSQQQVIVTFNSSVTFNLLRLVVKDAGKRESFKIKFLDKAGNSQPKPCLGEEMSNVSDTTMDIHCKLDTSIQQVIVSGDGVGSLCSLYVSGEVDQDAQGNNLPLAITAGLLAGLLPVAALGLGSIFIIWRKRNLMARKARNTESQSDTEPDGSSPENKREGRVQGIEIIVAPPVVGVDNMDTPRESTINEDVVEPAGPAKDKPSVDGTDGPEPEMDHNTVIMPITTSMAVKDLKPFIRSHGKEFFRQQFLAIPENKDAHKDIERRLSIEYAEIFTYINMSVYHMENQDQKQSDYVNASYIQGYRGDKHYMASQGPTKAVLNDFVRMLWEQNVEKIVMLTNLVEDGTVKCERYWPEEGEMDVGEIKIRLTTTEVFADYTIRTLMLSKANAPDKKITQFHFTSWPDMDVPQNAWALVDFEQRVSACPTDKPIVVHCCACVGRTVTFIALRNVMREAEDTGRVDFFTTVQRLRVDRMKIFQTQGQYEFLHKASQVAILCMGTTVTASDVHSRLQTLTQISVTGKSRLEKEFKDICQICDDSDDKCLQTDEMDQEGQTAYQNSPVISNRDESRSSNILPNKPYQVHLMTDNDQMGNYINAVLIPSFTKPDQWILTQLPMPTTVIDFWRMVIQFDVSLIVALELDSAGQDTTITKYLPAEGLNVAKIAPFSIEAGPSVIRSQMEERALLVTADVGTNLKVSSYPSLDGGHHVTHLKCKATDLDPAKWLSMALEIRSHRPTDDSRIVYMCSNGAELSGLMTVVLLLLDRMDNDHRLTVPLVVGAIKTIRPEVIPTLEQYRLLYKIMKLYEDVNNVYNNIGDEAVSNDSSIEETGPGTDK